MAKEFKAWNKVSVHQQLLATSPLLLQITLMQNLIYIGLESWIEF